MKTIDDYYISNPRKLGELINKLPQEKRKEFHHVFDIVDRDIKRFWIFEIIAQLRVEANKIPYTRFDILDFED
jgi:hypothetical protein